MIILDASVLIGHLESTDAHHVEATKLLMTFAAEPFGSCVVTVAEIYVGAARAGQAEQLSQLLARLAIESLELPADGARRLGELRAITQLKMPDCCVLYTAEYHGAAIATFDEKLASRAVQLGVRVARRATELSTQPITGPDLAAGRIRIPVAVKHALPATRGTVRVNLRGRDVEARWDPRNGPDRSRSGVLSFGRALLNEAAALGERLSVSPHPDGRITLT